MSRGGSPAHRRRHDARLRRAARQDALTGKDGVPRLRQAIDGVVREHGDHDLGAIFVNNGARGPNVVDTRHNPGGWLLEGAVPKGTLAAFADQDDGSPEALLAQGYDVVLYMHGRGAMEDRPVRFEVLWRDGLRPGESPPAPFWVRFSSPREGFVRCDPPEGES